MTSFYMERNAQLKCVITRLILIIIADLKVKNVFFVTKIMQISSFSIIFLTVFFLSLLLLLLLLLET